MGAVDTTYTFTATDTITSTKMNNIIDQTTMTADAVIGTTLDVSGGKLKIRTGGITSNELSANCVTQSNTNNSLVPSGAVMQFAMNSAPTGWLIANGDSVPNGVGTVQGVTADFSGLYAAVSTSFGIAGTLPDLRGIFARGSGSQTIGGVTYSKTFATKEQDSVQNITGSLTNVMTQAGAASGALATSGGALAAAIGNAYNLNNLSFDASMVVRTSTETRPANIALLYCIKY